MEKTFLTAEWRKLLMAQYQVDPSILAPFLPQGLELDLFRGRCYVSLVGFLFDRVRVKGIAFPLHTRFEEINLRFYVRRREQDGTVRRGVVFVRELVPRMAIAWIAKHLYEEPYLTAPTARHIAFEGDTLSVGYRWKFGGRWHSLSGVASSSPAEIEPDSEEEFITEHYWGYTKRSSGRTSAYPVEHPSWQHYPLRSFTVDADFGLLYGPAFAALSSRSPDGVLLAEGSPVRVGDGQNLPL